MKIQLICLICSGIYLLKKIYVLTLKKYRKFNIAFFIFIFISILSCIFSEINVAKSMLFFLKLIVLLIFTEYVHERKYTKVVLKQYGFLYLIYVLIAIFVNFKYPNLFILNEKNYLIGNKFSVSYSAFMSIIFLNAVIEKSFYKKNKLRFYYIIIFIFFIYICYLVDCNTGILCFILYLLINHLNINKLKSGKKVILIAILSSMLLLVLGRYILNLSFVKHFIVDILNRDLTLSGRVQIYDNMFQMILKKIFLGYGYNNNYTILHSAIGAPNTQNALVEWVFNSGLIGLFFLLLSIYIVFEYHKKNSNSPQSIYTNSLIVGIYVYLILGSIEITIGMYFFELLLFSNIGEKQKVGNKIEN